MRNKKEKGRNRLEKVADNRPCQAKELAFEDLGWIFSKEMTRSDLHLRNMAVAAGWGTDGERTSLEAGAPAGRCCSDPVVTKERPNDKKAVCANIICRWSSWEPLMK